MTPLFIANERFDPSAGRLAQNNPDEPHANCELYALWRLREAPVPHERRK